jgi:gamma-glutamyltranspeptidase / glutathione hydrolase
MKRQLALILALVFASGPAILLGQRKAPERAARFPARGMNGAVAAGSDYAADAGMRLYYAGGNAVDAGIAATACRGSDRVFALRLRRRSADAHPHPTGKVASTRLPASVRCLNSPRRNCSANAACSRRRSAAAGARWPEARIVPVAGLMPALVPGMVDAALAGAARTGRHAEFEDVPSQPAIELADATPLDETRASSISASRRFSICGPPRRPCSGSWGGQLPRAGDIFRQPDLARTLREMVAAEKKARCGQGRAASRPSARCATTSTVAPVARKHR